jgi:hypothetical protein
MATSKCFPLFPQFAALVEKSSGEFCDPLNDRLQNWGGARAVYRPGCGMTALGPRSAVIDWHKLAPNHSKPAKAFARLDH